MNAIGGEALGHVDHVGIKAPSWWSRGWRYAAGAATVTIIGVTAFVVAAAGGAQLHP